MSTPVVSPRFLLNDDEQASMTIKPELPEYEVVVKAKKLPETTSSDENKTDKQ